MTAPATTSDQQAARSAWVRWRKPGTIFIGVATVAGTIAGLGQWLGWPG